MKAIFTTLLFCLSSLVLQAQPILFNKTYNFTNQWENLNGIYEEEDAYFFIQNNTGSTYEDNQLFFAKVDKYGNEIWNYSFCGDSSICRSARGSLIKTVNNTYLSKGEYRPHPDTLVDPVIFEFSTEGDSIQFKRYPRPGVQGFSYMAKHPNGGYILSGGDKSIDGSGDVYVVRLDENLEVIWEKTIEQPGFQIGYTVDVTSDNGYFVTGKGLVTWGMAQIIALKLDSLGNLEWYQTLGGEGNNDGRHNGTVLSDGSFLVAANVRNASDTNFDAYMAKLTPEGDIIWERTYSENTRTMFSTNILELEDGSFVIGGAKHFSSTIYSRIAKYSPQGDEIWEQLYHGRLPIDCYFWAIKRANDGGFIGYGTAFGDDPITQQDGWIVKMDSEGQSCDDNPDCLLVNIAEVEASGKAQLTVSPNPANNQALLYYYLPKVLFNCSIEVYDLSGRLVFSESHQQASQEYGVQLDVSAWPSGMYVVQLRSEKGVLLASSLLVRG